MACKQKDAAYLTDEASMQEGGGVSPACRRMGWGLGSSQPAGGCGEGSTQHAGGYGGGGVKPACRRTGMGLCLECLPASEWKGTPQEREKERGGLSLQAHTHCGLVLA